ncbi:MAG: hypothetical protein V4568_12595 [Pseudomonadota bacterium]
MKPNKLLLPMLTAVLLSMATSAFALTSEEDRQLENSSIPDVTPRQLFTTATREAGGAYKEARRECATLNAKERGGCLKEAKATYEQEMSEARAELKNHAK